MSSVRLATKRSCSDAAASPPPSADKKLKSEQVTSGVKLSKDMKQFNHILNKLYNNEKPNVPSFLTPAQIITICSQKLWPLSDGALYRGQWDGNRATGIGEKVVCSKGLYRRHIGYFENSNSSGVCLIDDAHTSYTGQCQADVEHGEGRQVHRVTGETIEGVWERGVVVSGTATLTDKTTFTGTFKNGEPAYGRYCYPPALAVKQGLLSYEGEVQQGEPHGRGKAVYEDKFTFTGNWVRGQPVHTADGVIDWPLIDKTLVTYRGACKPAARGPTSDGLTGVLEFSNNKLQNGTYTGGLINLKQEGYGVRAYANGDRYEGQYKNGLEHGHGDWLEVSGGDTNYVHYVGGWRHNVEHGPAVMTYQLHKIGRVRMECTMVNGKAVGHARVYYSRTGSRAASKLTEVLYDGDMYDSQYHGEGRLWHPDKWSYDGDWINGELKGFGCLWYHKENSFWSGGMSWDGRHGLGKLFIYNTKPDGTHHDTYSEHLEAIELHRLSFNWESPCTMYLSWSDPLFDALGYKPDQQDKEEFTPDSAATSKKRTAVKKRRTSKNKQLPASSDDDDGRAAALSIEQHALKRKTMFEHEFYTDDTDVSMPVNVKLTCNADGSVVVVLTVHQSKLRLRRMNIERAYTKCLQLGVCTFAVTKRIGLIQDRHKCLTCTQQNGKSQQAVYVCDVCAEQSSCHAGHTLELETRESDNDLVYCDCGLSGRCMATLDSEQFKLRRTSSGVADKPALVQPLKYALPTTDETSHQHIFASKVKQGRHHYKSVAWYPVDDWITKQRLVLF